MMEEMNEVHEFMSKFHDDVETKWGLSTDPSLDKKVKITILATGFGISNVPGIQAKLDAEEEQRRQKSRSARRNTRNAATSSTAVPTRRAFSAAVPSSICSDLTTSTTKR